MADSTQGGGQDLSGNNDGSNGQPSNNGEGNNDGGDCYSPLYDNKALAADLQARCESVLDGRLANQTASFTPSNIVCLHDIGLNKQEGTYWRLRQFADIYAGDDRAVIRFCNLIMQNADSKSEKIAQIPVYSRSSHKFAISSRIIDAIANQ